MAADGETATFGDAATAAAASSAATASATTLDERARGLARGQLVEPWQALKKLVATSLAVTEPDSAWRSRVVSSGMRLCELVDQDADVALYMMLQTATREFDNYSASHAMFCAVVGELCAQWLEWPEAEVAALRHAALTMNIGMRAMQDVMVRQSGAVSEAQRRCIDEHAERSVEMLEAAGVGDALWLETVRRHHRPFSDGAAGEAADPDDPPQRLAGLLQRIDVFTAKLSTRKTRAGTTATVAARDACLSPSGVPDETGATLLRVLGLYPPGSYVRLVTGEVAVVTGRGAKAHTPLVASLRRGDGALLGVPALRDTSLPACRVERSLSANEVRISVSHERALAAR